MHEDAGRDEEWQAAQRAETLYRQLDDADRLGDALLLKATIAMDRGQKSRKLAGPCGSQKGW